MTDQEWEDQWAQLRAHLGEVKPIFDAFCVANGFVDVSHGRYPRICVSGKMES